MLPLPLPQDEAAGVDVVIALLALEAKLGLEVALPGATLGETVPLARDGDGEGVAECSGETERE